MSHSVGPPGWDLIVQKGINSYLEITKKREFTTEVLLNGKPKCLEIPKKYSGEG